MRVSSTFPCTAPDPMQLGGSFNPSVVVGVLVSVVIILIAMAIVLMIFLVYWRRRPIATDTENEKISERRIIAQEENADNGRGKEAIVMHSVEQQPPPYDEKSGLPEDLNAMNNKEAWPTDPSSYSSRNSYIESDFHFPADANLNSRPALVTICETDEAAGEQRIR